MYFVMLGVSFKTAPIEVREKLSVPDSDIPRALDFLMSKEEIMESIIISTCNRVEVYSFINDIESDVLRGFFYEYLGFDGDLDKYSYFLTGEDVIRHLCKVSTGLDSMVIGEPQIFGQVKEAFNRALECKAAGSTFKYLFPQVFRVVKKIRSKTSVGRCNVSVSYAAINLAKKIFKDFEKKCVLILGAGEMGELTVRNLIHSGVSGVLVANRTFQKAVELADQFNGTPIMLYEIIEYIPKIDILISSIGAPDFVLSYDQMKKLEKIRKNKDIFIIDIAVPRSIDPQIDTIKNVHLFNVDDLKDVVECNVEIRKTEAKKGEKIIDSKTKEIMRKMKSHNIIPLILDLRSKAEKIRQKRLDETFSKKNFSDDDKKTIEYLTESITKKILHHTEITLREYTEEAKGEL